MRAPQGPRKPRPEQTRLFFFLPVTLVCGSALSVRGVRADVMAMWGLAPFTTPVAGTDRMIFCLTEAAAHDDAACPLT